MLISYKENRIVNLTNVSNIFVEESKNKVIFNMNYSVKIFGDKTTADYTYWEYKNEKEQKEIVELIESKLKLESWIFPPSKTLRYVNIDSVSSISFDSYNNRVIFNLCYPITHPKDDRKLTSDYVFYNMNSKEDYNKLVENINFLTNKI